MADQVFFFLDMYTSAQVVGSSERVGTQKWLELDSWSFSMQQNADPNVGGGKPKTTAAAGRFTFTIKYAGPAIFKHCSIGSMITGAITFRAFRGGLVTTGAPGTQPTTPYFELVFTNTVVAGRSLSGGSGDKTENIELAFQSVKMTYWQILAGMTQPALTKQYDMKTNIVQ